MANWWRVLWGKVPGPTAIPLTEVERITALQRVASHRRAEFAALQEQGAAAGDSASHSAAEVVSRKRMKDAESAHMAALQAWQNKESRQRSG